MIVILVFEDGFVETNVDDERKTQTFYVGKMSEHRDWILKPNSCFFSLWCDSEAHWVMLLREKENCFLPFLYLVLCFSQAGTK